MNIPIEEIKEGLEELVKQPDGIDRLAKAIHLILSLMENTNVDIKSTVQSMFKNQQN